MAIGLKFRIKKKEGMYYLLSEKKGADQLCSYCAADLRLSFLHMQKAGFFMMRLIFCALEVEEMRRQMEEELKKKEEELANLSRNYEERMAAAAAANQVSTIRAVSRENYLRGFRPFLITRLYSHRRWLEALGRRGIVLCSENKGADQLQGDGTADLHLCFRIFKKQDFL